MQQTYPVKKENGLCYIDGVPRLRWGQYRDCTYCGALETLLRVIGVKTSYEQLMGMTGSGYRFGMCYGWDPGSLIVNTSYAYQGFDTACGTDDNTNRALGLAFYTIADKAKRDAAVRKSITSGVPVLALGAIGEPEWCLLTGYAETDGGVTYFGRSYFDSDADDAGTYTDNRYAPALRYPGESPELFLKLCDRSCAPLDATAALKTSLEACLKLFAPHPYIGYGAYAFMIDSLQTDRYGNPQNPVAAYSGWDISMHFTSLLDARRAAYRYLEDMVPLLSGKNQQRLAEVAAGYRQMFEVLSAVLPYERLYAGAYDTAWPAEVRQDVIAALQKLLSLERQVHATVKTILADWQV